jgi:hypothetical protein
MARVTNKSNDAQCELELDDRTGDLPIPKFGSKLIVNVGWRYESLVGTFSGIVKDIEYSAQRGSGGGRRMFIHGTGMDTLTTHLKTPMQEHTGDGAEPGQKEGSMVPFSEHMQKVFSNAGASIAIHPQLAGMARDYWAQNGESAIQHAQNFADQFGGIFRVIDGNKGEITVPGQSVLGGPNGTIVAKWGANLISCRVRPMATNNVWGSAQQQHYETQTAGWLKTLTQSGVLPPAASGVASWLPHSAAGTGTEGGQEASGAASNEGYIGYGRIVMNGEPFASFNGYTMLTGVRPGVDGLYLNMSVEQLWSRPSGFITTIEVLSVGTAAAKANILSGMLDPNFTPQLPSPPTAAEVQQVVKRQAG